MATTITYCRTCESILVGFEARGTICNECLDIGDGNEYHPTPVETPAEPDQAPVCCQRCGRAMDATMEARDPDGLCYDCSLLLRYPAHGEPPF